MTILLAAFCEAVERSPQNSLRRLCRELRLPETTRFPSKDKTYHMEALHYLKEDYATRMAMRNDLLEAVENGDFLDNILCTHEATFPTRGSVNRHSCRIFSDSNSHEVRGWERITMKVHVWLGITKTKIYGPFTFAEEAINCKTYLDMLEFFFTQN